MQAPDPQLDGAVPQTGEDVALILGRSVVLRDPRFDRAAARGLLGGPAGTPCLGPFLGALVLPRGDRKSTRLNSSHVAISYAVFCLKKKNRNLLGIVRKNMAHR